MISILLHGNTSYYLPTILFIFYFRHLKCNKSGNTFNRTFRNTFEEQKELPIGCMNKITDLPNRIEYMDNF